MVVAPSSSSYSGSSSLQRPPHLVGRPAPASSHLVDRAAALRDARRCDREATEAATAEAVAAWSDRSSLSGPGDDDEDGDTDEDDTDETKTRSDGEDDGDDSEPAAAAAAISRGCMECAHMARTLGCCCCCSPSSSSSFSSAADCATPTHMTAPGRLAASKDGRVSKGLWLLVLLLSLLELFGCCGCGGRCRRSRAVATEKSVDRSTLSAIWPSTATLTCASSPWLPYFMPRLTTGFSVASSNWRCSSLWPT